MKVIVSACPEVLLGLPKPRPSAEIVDGKVMNTEGRNFCSRALGQSIGKNDPR